MNPDGFGMWIIFPIIMIPTMLIFMYLMFVRGGGGPRWRESGREHQGPSTAHDPREHATTGVSEDAMAILNRRYASGEITKVEFDQMKQDLA